MNRNICSLPLCCVVLCCASSFSYPASADNDALLELIKVLRDKGTINESEYQALKRAADADQSRSQTEEDRAKIRTGRSALEVESADGAFKFRLGGGLMADAAFYDKDKTPLGNGAEIRRARLFTKGTVYTDWDYKAQVDFSGNEVSVKDMYLAYAGFDRVRITAGHHKEPFGLEELTSSKYSTFMERALPNTFAPSRQTGLSMGVQGKQWGTRAGYFLDGVANDSSPKSQGWGITGRAHLAPILKEKRIMHLGAAASYRGSDGDNRLEFRERPESHVTSTRLVDTDTISNYDRQTIYGLEGAAVLGPFSIQGEYLLTRVDRKGSGVSNPDFNGWYVFGSYFLTGEHRTYDAGKGVFGRVKPKGVVGKGGYGAWEIAARYSSLDLNDGGIAGGEQRDITLGLNWYATPNIRFMANYVRAATDPTSLEKGGLKGSGADEDINIFQIRSQIDF